MLTATVYTVSNWYVLIQSETMKQNESNQKLRNKMSPIRKYVTKRVQSESM